VTLIDEAVPAFELHDLKQEGESGSKMSGKNGKPDKANKLWDCRKWGKRSRKKQSFGISA